MKDLSTLFKTCLWVGFLLLIFSKAHAQNQKIADSLKIIYDQGNLKDTARFRLLENLSFNEVRNPELALQYANELIDASNEKGNFIFLSKGYSQKGNTHILLGNYDLAIDAFFKSAEAAIKANSIQDQGVANMSIADIYSEIGNSNNANIYYEKSIKLLRKSTDTISLATALINAGDEAFNVEDFEKALAYFDESGQLFEKADYLIGKAYNQGNIGMVYAEQGKHELAETNMNEAIAVLEKLEVYSPIAEYLTYISDIYVRKNDLPKALDYLEKSLELAKNYGLKDQISEANLKLNELHYASGNIEKAYLYFQDYIVYRDSVINLENVQKIADQRTEFEVSQKQAELELSDQKRKNQQTILIAVAITTFLLALLAFGIYRRYQFTQKTNKIIAKERERSDNLLLNILPEETAQELKDTGKVKGKKYDEISVLFTDFKGFTSYSEKLSPVALVETVDYYFSKFDAIIEKHGLEKIKTIGDAYMCAGGLHGEHSDHAKRMVNAAFDIAQCVQEAKQSADNEMNFDIRIGINTGPVVAGVVGTKKFAYDIWGDTVNVAARMESNSEPGKINISENTYALIKDAFDCEPRGALAVKNRGTMQMYFVNGPKKAIPA